MTIATASPHTQQARRARTSLLRLYTKRFARNRPALIGLLVFVALALFAALGPWLTPYSHTDMDFLALTAPPSSAHWFGTSIGGHDTFTQVAVGLQRSLMIALSVSIGTTVISAIVGAAAAYLGGAVERATLLVIHFLMVIPTFLLLSILSNASGGDWRVITIIMILIGWYFPARVIWTLSLSLREREYIRAARYMGVGSLRIVLRHMIPNIGSLLVVNFTLGVVSAVMTETGLSFIGFGVKPPDVSLGSLIGDGASSLTNAPWLFGFPALALTLLTVSMALVADGLRDALDPSSAAGGQA